MELFLVLLIGVVGFLAYQYWEGSQTPRGTSTQEVVGMQGEMMVQSELAKLETQGYVIFNDILLGSGNKLTQIDHLVISRYGVFVIETKNYGGKVYGHLNAQQWKHITRRGTEYFYNPLKQNDGHMYAIKKAIGVDLGMNLHSLVVFTGRCELHIDPTNRVITINKLLQTILGFSRPVFTDADVQTIAMRINNSIVVGSAARDIHKRQVIEKQNRGVSKSHGICPRCGGRMELKSGKYGTFYGCSNYPRCKYTEKI